MNSRHLTPTWLSIVAMGTLIGTEAFSQLADPEADAPQPESPSVETRQPLDPAVAAVLATKPTTPSELIRAARILADLGRPDLAKGLLKKVLDANLDQQQLIALEGSLGAATFTDVASRRQLAPEGQQLGDAVLTAVNQHLQDPARLADLVKQLQDPSAEVRSRALAELQRGRDAAVGPLIAVLADPSRAAEHANVRTALVRLGSDAVGPLVAMLEASDAKLVVEAIRLLAALEAEQAAMFLLAPCTSDRSDPEVRQAAEAALSKLLGGAPSKAEAVRLLARRAEEHFNRSRPLREDLAGQVEIWTWDDTAKQPVKKMLLADEASLALASRLARDAYSLAPEDEAIRRLHLAAMLEQAAYENGLEVPLDTAEGTPGGRVAALGCEVIEDLLVYALEGGHAPAAAAAVRILGQEGDAESLLWQGARPTPLAQATWHPDRRVRFAAVEAILALQPARSFPGSSRVTEALGFFAASAGTPRALVAAAGTAEARRIGGYLVALGYELDTAVTGQDAIRQLLASPDYELALIGAAIERPTVDFLLQELRHDCRTAGLPVGVIARAGQLERAERIARRDPLAEAFSRPHTQESVQWQAERLLALVGRDRVLAAERQGQAALALKWLADWSGRDQKAFDFSRLEDVVLDALYAPGLRLHAAAALGSLNTRHGQQALVEVASRPVHPIELRTAAAKAFQENVRRNGILLTTKQILLQYDRYNQSETMDAATQQVLGSILDTIEAPSRAERQGTQKAATDANASTADGNVDE